MVLGRERVGNNAARKAEPSHDIQPSIPHNVYDSKTPHLGLLLTKSLDGQCSSWPCMADVYHLSLEPGSLAWRMPASSFTFKTGETSAFSLHWGCSHENCRSQDGSRKQYYQPPSACDDLPSAPLSQFGGSPLFCFPGHSERPVLAPPLCLLSAFWLNTWDSLPPQLANFYSSFCLKFYFNLGLVDANYYIRNG